jgi:hypothetical protein
MALESDHITNLIGPFHGDLQQNADKGDDHPNWRQQTVQQWDSRVFRPWLQQQH